MKFKNICEELETLIGEDPVYRNPSSVELNKLERSNGSSVKVVADIRDKSIYVFPSMYLHAQACKRISSLIDDSSLITTPNQPSYIFTGSGKIENNKITIVDSNTFGWSEFNSKIRKEILAKDWSCFDKYLNNNINDFLRHLKINK